MGAGNGEGAGEFAGASGEIMLPAAAFAHGLDTLKGLKRADEDAAGGAIWLGDDVEAFVHAVDEINIGAARGAEDDAGARGESAGGVSGEVADTEVSFHFDDAAGGFAMHEDLTQQVARDFDGGPTVEGAR